MSVVPVPNRLYPLVESFILDLTKEIRVPRREVVDGVKVAAVRCVVGICVVVSGVLQKVPRG